MNVPFLTPPGISRAWNPTDEGRLNPLVSIFVSPLNWWFHQIPSAAWFHPSVAQGNDAGKKIL